MKRIAAIVLGAFSLLSLVEIVLTVIYSFEGIYARVLIYFNFSRPATAISILLVNEIVLAVIHFIVFLTSFIFVVNNIIKTHHIHGDLEIAEHEFDLHHFFPFFFSFIAIVASIVSCCLKMINKQNPEPDFLIKVLLINFVFIILPCTLLMIYSRFSNKKWLIITAIIVYIAYKTVSFLNVIFFDLSDYHKFSTPDGVASLFLIIGYSLLIYAIIKGADCHKTLKVLLNALVIFTLTPYITIFFASSIEEFITLMFSLITSACVPVSLDLLVHKALPDKIKEDK